MSTASPFILNWMDPNQFLIQQPQAQQSSSQDFSTMYQFHQHFPSPQLHQHQNHQIPQQHLNLQPTPESQFHIQARDSSYETYTKSPRSLSSALPIFSLDSLPPLIQPPQPQPQQIVAAHAGPHFHQHSVPIHPSAHLFHPHPHMERTSFVGGSQYILASPTDGYHVVGDIHGLSSGSSASGSPNNGSSPPRKPKKLSIACHFCRKRKMKCDGQRPTCMQCLKREQGCTWDLVPRMRGRGKKNIAAEQARVQSQGTLGESSDSMGDLSGSSEFSDMKPNV